MPESPTHSSPTLFAGDTFTSAIPAEVGLPLTFPFVGSSVTPTATIRDVVVGGPFETGIRLRQCWNATLENVYVHGVLSDEEYVNPQTMQVGIDVGDSMDVHLMRPRITSANVGIRSGLMDVDPPVRAEGLHIDGGYLMHVNVGWQGWGSSLGGWPTPAQWISNVHINHLSHAIMGYQLSGVHITNNDLYASHLRTGQWAIYLIGCKHVEISGNHFWANRPGPFGAILLDNCEDVEIHGGILGSHVTTALLATPSCARVRVSGNQWTHAQTMGRVINHAQP